MYKCSDAFKRPILKRAKFTGTGYIERVSKKMTEHMNDGREWVLHPTKGWRSTRKSHA